MQQRTLFFIWLSRPADWGKGDVVEVPRPGSDGVLWSDRMTYLIDVFIPYFREITPLLLKGLGITLYVSSIAFAICTVLGVFLAIVQFLKIPVLEQMAMLYVSFFRGTPLLIQLFLFFYGLPMVMDLMKAFPKMWALITCLALNGAAYVSESVRGALESVDRGQYEAAVAFGMSLRKTMTRIMLPQAAVAAVPPMVNTALDIVKMSSLGMTIGIQDIMGQAQLSAAVTYRTFETYIIAATYYWLLAILLGRIQKATERKVGRAYLREAPSCFK